MHASGCMTCRDGEGMAVWPCACGRQRPVNHYEAIIYGVPVGTVLTPELRQRWLEERHPGWAFSVREQRYGALGGEQ